KDFEGFRQGDIFDTYEESKYTYVRKEDGDSTNFIKVHEKDFDKHFKEVGDFVVIPNVYEVSYRVLLFKKVVEDRTYNEWYEFDVETKYLRRIQREIFLPIYLINNNKFLEQFSGTVNYVLGSLRELVGMDSFEDVDLDTEITRAATYFNELLAIYRNADSEPKEQVIQMLDKHHVHMDAVLKMMKEINKQ
ncbi:hypothetical protein, partial [Bacillus mycoides]|uniref:hypothetical protein n=1 Tax=Bacillus mycoides TaxID=1405 RepID=UPI003A7F81E0